MFELLKASQGKVIIIELVDSRIFTGKVVSVDNYYLKLDTVEGTGTIPASTILVLWEKQQRNVTEDKAGSDEDFEIIDWADDNSPMSRCGISGSGPTMGQPTACVPYMPNCVPYQSCPTCSPTTPCCMPVIDCSPDAGMPGPSMPGKPPSVGPLCPPRIGQSLCPPRGGIFVPCIPNAPTCIPHIPCPPAETQGCAPGCAPCMPTCIPHQQVCPPCPPCPPVCPPAGTAPKCVPEATCVPLIELAPVCPPRVLF